jgi:formylglycine-generating enzyme required for sulfatase activity
VGYGDQSFPSTVSSFLLDKFEVTVGRIRKFKGAWDAGYRPTPGAGKHAHLSGRQGLADVNDQSGAHEQGWDVAWNSRVALTDAAFGTCGYDTWTSAPGAQENRPINCVNWYEAYAFCIWDGGFLPSEAEWNFAAAAGNEQRVYPWSVPASSTGIDPTRAAYCGGACSGPQIVGATPAGHGKFGQADLAGNVSEWILDANADYHVPCSDCAFLPPSPAGRVFRGGAFHNGALALRAVVRDYADPTTRIHYLGIRCARTPQ